MTTFNKDRVLDTMPGRTKPEALKYTKLKIAGQDLAKKCGQVQPLVETFPNLNQLVQDTTEVCNDIEAYMTCGAIHGIITVRPSHYPDLSNEEIKRIIAARARTTVDSIKELGQWDQESRQAHKYPMTLGKGFRFPSDNLKQLITDFCNGDKGPAPSLAVVPAAP